MAEKIEREKEKESGTKEKKFNDKLPTPETVSRMWGGVEITIIDQRMNVEHEHDLCSSKTKQNDDDSARERERKRKKKLRKTNKNFSSCPNICEFV